MEILLVVFTFLQVFEKGLCTDILPYTLEGVPD